VNKEVQQLIRRLKDQGFVVRVARNGHYRVTAPDGRQVTVPSSPSGGNRSLANARAGLRRWLGADV
jgi:predicted RNA binding protein YcfA (HicA-like mRNA interferase family)